MLPGDVRAPGGDQRCRDRSGCPQATGHDQRVVGQVGQAAAQRRDRTDEAHGRPWDLEGVESQARRDPRDAAAQHRRRDVPVPLHQRGHEQCGRLLHPVVRRHLRKHEVDALGHGAAALPGRADDPPTRSAVRSAQVRGARPVSPEAMLPNDGTVRLPRISSTTSRTPDRLPGLDRVPERLSGQEVRVRLSVPLVAPRLHPRERGPPVRSRGDRLRAADGVDRRGVLDLDDLDVRVPADLDQPLPVLVAGQRRPPGHPPGELGGGQDGRSREQRPRGRHDTPLEQVVLGCFALTDQTFAEALRSGARRRRDAAGRANR